MIAIVFYNLIGAIFRSMGDSKTPLMTVAIACVFNIAGDLFLIAGLGLGAKGAAIATVAAQLLSVIISVIIIRRKGLSFEFELKMIRFNGEIIGHVIRLGLPIALQDFLPPGYFTFVILSSFRSYAFVHRPFFAYSSTMRKK